MGNPSSDDKVRVQRKPGHCEPGLSLHLAAIHGYEPALSMILSEESQLNPHVKDKTYLLVATGLIGSHRQFHSTGLTISRSWRERESFLGEVLVMSACDVLTERFLSRAGLGEALHSPGPQRRTLAAALLEGTRFQSSLGCSTALAPWWAAGTVMLTQPLQQGIAVGHAPASSVYVEVCGVGARCVLGKFFFLMKGNWCSWSCRFSPLYGLDVQSRGGHVVPPK